METMVEAIERFLRQLLSERETLEIQRRQLAHYFKCAPSQINYVLTTRFNADRGYLVESRRGWGGFIRITRLPISRFASSLGDRIDREDIPDLLVHLVDEGAISDFEAALLRRALVRSFKPPADLGVMRAEFLRAVLTILDRRGRMEDKNNAL